VKRYSKLTTIVLMTALAISSGYLLSFLPNVELVLPIIFISGFITGISGGAITGFLTFIIYGYFNPYGPSPIYLLLSQCIGGGISGVFGGIYKRLRDNIFLCGLFGFFLTFIYDLITTITGFFLFPTKQTFFAYIISGIIFYIIHLLSATAIFTIIIYPLTRRLKI